MHGFVAEGISIDQAAGIWLVVWVRFNNLTLKNAEEDFVKR
jgi:hypothetical protein